MSERSYYPGTGRRKTAIAQVRLTSGTGAIIVNGMPFEERFHREVHRFAIRQPLAVLDSLTKFNVTAKVAGGGDTGQAEAIRHGIARALLKFNEAFRIPLRQHGLLTRDPRAKERKKYGLRGARKAPQYTKR
ncbi:MAG: 30S ribosomal protein S9 [Dehalococcoidia bacterium]|nr:30S ribosomal protein S9 [Dehalococcoidia bacterium]